MVHVKYVNFTGDIMRPKVYIDGANIAHEDSETILASRIEIAFEELKKLGFEPHVLLPNYIEKKMKDSEIVKKLINERRLSLISNHDDEVLITIANKKDAYILTNDRFKDHKQKDWWSQDIDKWIETKIIPYEFIEGEFILPISVQNRLPINVKPYRAPQMCLPEFKKHVTNGGISSKTRFEEFPEPVQKMLKLIQENPGETTFATLGSQLKNNTGYGINDLFRNSKHATRFLKSRGFSIRQEEYNIYVEGIAE